MSNKLATMPKDSARELYQQGLREQAAGRMDAAIGLFDAALRIKPDYPEALCSGGYILQRNGHIEGALAFYGRAIELKPDYFDALFNRGVILFELKRLPEAISHFQRACKARPRDADARSNLGTALYTTGQLEEAIKALRRALKINPKLLEAELNLGSAYRRLGQNEEAGQAFQRALRLAPNSAEAWCGIGIVARNKGDYEAAMRAYDKALELDPNLEEALSSRGCLQLMLGNFEDGWEGYESRWIYEHRPIPISDSKFDLSKTETIKGKKVLVVNDHGLGDTIQFFRYIILLVKAGADVTFAGPPKMQRLLSSSGVKITFRDTEDLSGTFDAAVAISSLPRAFSTRLETIPADMPYLAAEPEKAAFWQERMAGSGLKIGLCWRGNKDFRVDPRRSFQPTAMMPLTEVEGAQFYSLHMDVAEGELLYALAKRVTVFGDDFDRGPDAFIDTAAVMENLDLIITCDTSIAHLAGALGKPAWVLLRHHAEWRWLTERDDSPWYPSLRLLRCNPGDDWVALFKTITSEINTMTQGQQS